MPKILPLLEQKRKQLYGDLQIKIASNLNALKPYYYPSGTKGDPTLLWALVVTLTRESLFKTMQEYDNVIEALILEKEQWRQSNDPLPL